MRVAVVVCLALLVLPAQADERSQIGRLFSVAGVVAGASPSEPDIPASPVLAPKIKIDGFVSRSSGKNTVWINGQGVTDSNAPAVNAARVSAVKIDDATNLKVGELLDRENGSKMDILPTQAIAKGKP